jgi:hypothetical protein
MSFIKSRLRRLEQRGRGGRCEECGLPPEGPGYIVHSDSEAGLPDDPGELCPKCGRRLWLVIQVVYDGEEGEGDTT